MKFIKIIFSILAAVALSSCSAIRFGTTTEDATLSSRNFKYIKPAAGTSAIHTILGIGGQGKDALVFEAKKDMLLNNPLKERQVLANVTLDFTTNYFLIFQTQKVTVTADIVEFNEIGSNKAEVRKTKMPEPQTDKIKDATQPIPNATAPKAAKTETENVPTPKVTKTETEKTPTPKATTIKKEKAPEQQAPKIEKENSPVPVSNTTPTPVPGFEPTILYSQEADIVTSSGERYKVETGDYFIGTLDEKGNPENGKLYGKNGRPKHVILPRRNH